MADYRFEDNSEDYLVDTWETVDLSSLLGATRLSFAVTSSDVGVYGLNTPAYFALDNLVLSASDAISVREYSSWLSLLTFSALGLGSIFTRKRNWVNKR